MIYSSTQIHIKIYWVKVLHNTEYWHKQYIWY